MKILLVLIALVGSCLAQDVHIVPTQPVKAAPAKLEGRPALGDTRDRVHLLMGDPKEIWIGKASKHYSIEQAADAIAIWRSPFADVYMLATSHNEYELRIWYSGDSSKSRLHPALRVDRIDFVLDKDLPLATALGDIAEARALCATGCTAVVVEDKIEAGRAPQVYLYAGNAPLEQLRTAAAAARGFSEEPNAVTQWYPGMRVEVAGEDVGGPWLKVPVKGLSVVAVSPESLRSSAGYLRYFKELGNWTP
jgi:hypothetical protein